jgi:hypothetical protein
MTHPSLLAMDIPATASSPQVLTDPDRGLIVLAGESYPENSFEFYRPIAAWVADFMERDQRGLTLEIRLSYLNTSSIKCLIDLLDELEEAHHAGRSVALNWYYDSEDDRAMELAEEFKEDLTLPFTILPVQRQG